MKVRINELKKGKLRGYKIRWIEDGKRKESFRKTYENALIVESDVKERLIGDTEEVYRKTHLTEDQLKDAEAAIRLLDDKLSMTGAATVALEHWFDPENTIPLEDAYWKFLGSIEDEGLAKETYRKYKNTAWNFKEKHSGKVTSIITDKTVADFLGGFQSKVTHNTRRRELSRFLNYLKSQGWIAHNPLDTIKAKKTRGDIPEVITPEQAATLMEAAENYKNGELVPYYALALFAGIRREELERLMARADWRNIINVKTKNIKLPGTITKTGEARNILIRPALLAFLELVSTSLHAPSSGVMKSQIQGHPNTLVNIDRLMELIFDPESYPSKRIMLEQKAQGKLPFHKIGRRVFYKPSEVLEAITNSQARVGVSPTYLQLRRRNGISLLAVPNR